MYHFPSNNIFYSNTYYRGTVEVIIFKVSFKAIKDFVTSPNFEKSRKKFYYESVKSKALQRQTIVLQCYIIIPRRVTILHDNRLDFNKNTDVFKYLTEVPPSYDWF